MANHDLPCTVSVAATATEITVNGHWTRLCARNLGTVPVYARSDGTAAEVAADQNWALPAGAPEDTDLLCAPSGGALAVDGDSPVTVLSMIATSGTALVHLRAEDD